MARVVILGPEYPAHPSIATRASSSFRRSPRRSCRTAMRQAPRVRSRCATRARKRSGEVEQLRYDYFINATGPKLRFDAVHAAAELDKVIATLKTGVRDLAEVIYLANEAQLGDFGVDGMMFVEHGFKQSSRMWTESIFTERGVHSILGAHVTKVCADYTQKPYDQWRAEDWPETYEVPGYRNIFAVGIAFAPPHGISKPRTSPTGTVIAPSPPRTRMPSGVMGKTDAKTIIDRISGKPGAAHRAAMSRLGAACVASSGTGLRRGSAATMTMFPVVPNYQTYPDTGGRNIKGTRGQIGLSGHWLKLMLHYLLIYKAKARPGWSLIPE